MSDYKHHASNWQIDAQQLIADGQWEEVLALWVQQTTTRTLGLWLIGCLRDIGQYTSGQLLDEMQRWYAEPNEKLRWQIFHRAEIHGFDTLAGALALSLFWSQGSMSPEGLEPVYPEPRLSAQMLHCVLLMLASLHTDNPADGTRYLLTQWINQENA